MAENRQYDHEYKVQAVKLAKEIGQAKAAKELGIPKNTMYGWVRANRLGNLDLGVGSQTPQSAMTLNEELLKLRHSSFVACISSLTVSGSQCRPLTSFSSVFSFFVT